MPTLNSYGRIQYNGGEALPAVGSPEYDLAQKDPGSLLNFKAANPGLDFNAEDKAAYDKASPVAVLSSTGGSTALDQHVQDHTKDMTALAPKTTTDKTQPDPYAGMTKIFNSKTGDVSYSAPGVTLGRDWMTADEAAATGTIIPSQQGTVSGVDYSKEEKTINDAFTKFGTTYDTATANMVKTIQDSYLSRIADEKMAVGRSKNTTANYLRGAGFTGLGVQGVLSGIEQDGLDRINKLNLEENKVLAEANQALLDKKYVMFSDLRNQLKDLRTEKVAQLNKLQDQDLAKKKLDLDVAAFNEKSANDLATNAREAEKVRQGKYEFRDLKDAFGNVVGTQIFDKATGQRISAMPAPGTTPTTGNNDNGLSPVGINPNGSVNTDEQKAFLAKLPPPIASLVTGLINYTAKPPANTKNGQMLNAYAHMADPTYDESQYLIRQKLTQDYTSGPTGKNIQSLNTSVNHLADLAKNFVNLPNSDIKAYNTIKDWWSANIKGKGDVTKVITDLNAVTGELAKVYKGTGATDQEISHIKEGISINSSPEQFKSFIEEATSLLGGRLDALNQTYENSIGKPFPRSFLAPDTMERLNTLKNQGYAIDVKGSRYTDPQSFIKSSPENLNLFTHAANEFPEYSAEDILQIIQE